MTLSAAYEKLQWGTPVMTLSAAYERLQWGTPVAYERLGLQKVTEEGHPLRNLGTSAHMLVELYLDMDRSLRIGGLRTPPANFLVVCRNGESGRYLRNWLATIHASLALNVDLARVHFFGLGQNPDRLGGQVWYSWAIFCDHFVKERFGLERNIGPYRLVRSIEPLDGVWVARDRDDEILCHLTAKGMNEVADAATCPYTLIQDDLVNTQVTYPAIQHDDLNPLIRLRRSFER